VTAEGAAGGRVVSSPTGIDCPGHCFARFDQGEVVTLIAEPDLEAAFSSWSGALGDPACGSGSTTMPTCMLTMNVDRSVAASFVMNCGISRPTGSTSAHCALPPLRRP
jgi:hypothetical protein